jgi:hypothetical protein
MQFGADRAADAENGEEFHEDVADPTEAGLKKGERQVLRLFALAGSRVRLAAQHE